MSPAAKKTSAKGEKVRYADLMTELEQILEDLENDAIDVDELGARVQRASELIRICRERLVASRTEIEQVVADLDALQTDSPEESALDDADPDEA